MRIAVRNVFQCQRVTSSLLTQLIFNMATSCEEDEQNDSLQKYSNNTGNVRMNVTPMRVRVTTVPVGKQ